MVDYQNSVNPAVTPGETGVPETTKTSFLNTTTGKLVVGGIALVLVLGAVGAAVFFFVMGGALNGAVNEAVKLPPIKQTQNSAAATQTPVEPAQRSLASTFTFRNIFAPTVKRTFAASATTSGSASVTSDTPSVSVPSNTLYLQSIISENGKPMAVFIWNGATYTVGEGVQVGTSPWKVLKINSDSALMLYGDSQVTLSVGQGVGK